MDDIKCCTEHDDIGVIIRQSKDPKPKNVSPLGKAGMAESHHARDCSYLKQLADQKSRIGNGRQ